MILFGMIQIGIIMEMGIDDFDWDNNGDGFDDFIWDDFQLSLVWDDY